MIFHRDYETRSTVDLKKTGAHVYMRHPTTSIWCASYAVDAEPVKIWLPSQPVPAEFIAAANDPDAECWAHNNAFEQEVERHIGGPRHGLPVFDLKKQRCTMVTGYALSLPGSLELAAPAVGIKGGKDMIGHRLMLQLAKPRGKIEYANGYVSIPFDGVRVAEMDADGWETYEHMGRTCARVRWWNDPEKLAKLYAYCQQDTVVEREYHHRLRPLKQSELELWHLDQVINQRGVFIDRKLCEAAKTIIAAAEDDLDAQMVSVSGKAIGACSNRNQVLAYVRERGMLIDGLAKDVLEDVYEEGIVAAMARFEAEQPDSALEWVGSVVERAADVKRVLDLWKLAARASVAKIETLLRGADPVDMRVRGLLQFLAASTGRWAGRRFQPQNLKRPEEIDIPAVIDAVQTGDYEWISMLYSDPLSAVSDILRGLICAALGKKIVAADLANIEGRVLAWLAGEEWKLQAFRDFDAKVGPDLYIKTYSETFGVPLFDKKDPRRQVGKVMELAFGYQGGVGAWRNFETSSTPSFTDKEVNEIKDAWRAKHAATKQFWYDMEKAAIAAVREKGSTHHVGKITFRMAGSFLFMRLPSGRFMAYPNAVVQSVKTKWVDDKTGEPIYKDALTYFSTIDPSKKGKIVYDPLNSSTWARISTYGGMLVENATQAVARDILAHSMPKLEEVGYPVILTVHDEIVSEPDADHGSAAEMEEIMCDLPAWARGCPVAAEGFEGARYKK